MTKITVCGCLRFVFGLALLMLVIVRADATGRQMTMQSGLDSYYFSFKPTSSLPASPFSLLIQSPTFFDVPAGAVLSVRLMRGDTLVATSTLTFQQAYLNQLQLPAVPIASFVPPGSSTNGGQPLPNTSLTVGTADLARVTMEPSAYKVFWNLSAGLISTPRSAIFTGLPGGFVIVDLELSAVSAASVIGDQKPGSVLFFNRYTSSASNPTRENSTLNITNTNSTTQAFVRLFLVSGTTCQTTELQLCLAAQETVSLLMSDFDPGVKGYAMAVATNSQGQPIQFNWLTGNVVVKQTASNSGGPYSSMLGAVALAKRKDGAIANVNGFAEMTFDDVNYDRLPGQIAFDSVPSQVGATNLTVVSVYRPLTDFSSIPNAAVQITGWSKNNSGQVATSAGNLNSTCYSDVLMSTFRLQPTVINQFVPTGTTAWFAASSVDLLPLMGSQFNTGEFNGGNNARPLTFSAEYKIRIPVAAVTCP
ncbi:MAG: hypothetical protein SF097_09470 [Acidobacteriota bacterium]|nr:hypothetical protein [Acidobacteriota bacterium]